MALESSEVRVTGTGHCYVAPIGTTIPAGISSALTHAAGWIELGYCTEDGAQFKFDRNTNDIMGWQSPDPLRTVVTAVPKEITVSLMQWNQHTVKLALGGGTFTEPVSGQYEYNPPDSSFVDERMFAIEGIDGAYTYRFIYRRAFNIAPVEFSFVRADAAVLPITMKVIAPDAPAQPFTFQHNDPNIGLLTGAAS